VEAPGAWPGARLRALAGATRLGLRRLGLAYGGVAWLEAARLGLWRRGLARGGGARLEAARLGERSWLEAVTLLQTCSYTRHFGIFVLFVVVRWNFN